MRISKVRNSLYFVAAYKVQGPLGRSEFTEIITGDKNAIDKIIEVIATKNVDLYVDSNTLDMIVGTDIMKKAFIELKNRDMVLDSYFTLAFLRTDLNY